MAVRDWSTIPSNNASQPGIDLTEGMLPSQLNDDMRQVMADIASMREEGDYKIVMQDATTATTQLDFAVAQVFRVAVPSNIALTFVNPPPSNKSMTAIVHLTDASLSTRTVTWPASVIWNGGAAPIMTGTRVAVILHWTGAEWIGTAGPRS